MFSRFVSHISIRFYFPFPGMCKATLNRNMYRAQLYMRGRVAAQFFTVCVLTGGAIYMGFRHQFGSSPGEIPGQPDLLTQKMLNRNAE